MRVKNVSRVTGGHAATSGTKTIYYTTFYKFYYYYLIIVIIWKNKTKEQGNRMALVIPEGGEDAVARDAAPRHLRQHRVGHRHKVLRHLDRRQHGRQLRRQLAHEALSCNVNSGSFRICIFRVYTIPMVQALKYFSARPPGCPTRQPPGKANSVPVR